MDKRFLGEDRDSALFVPGRSEQSTRVHLGTYRYVRKTLAGCDNLDPSPSMVVGRSENKDVDCIEKQ
jgi:hypothetical protein